MRDLGPHTTDDNRWCVLLVLSSPANEPGLRCRQHQAMVQAMPESNERRKCVKGCDRGRQEARHADPDAMCNGPTSSTPTLSICSHSVDLESNKGTFHEAIDVESASSIKGRGTIWGRSNLMHVLFGNPCKESERWLEMIDAVLDVWSPTASSSCKLSWVPSTISSDCANKTVDSHLRVDERT